MRVLTIAEAERDLDIGMKLGEFLTHTSSRLAASSISWPTISDSGKKAATARLMAEILLSHSSCYIYIESWGVWPSCEIPDLFYGYRQSRHEGRLLIEAPVHFFPQQDVDEFTSILGMVLYFLWDASIFNCSGEFLVTVDHDEVLSAASTNPMLIGTLGASLERYGYQRNPPSGPRK
jgi:hypothetical protein